MHASMFTEAGIGMCFMCSVLAAAEHNKYTQSSTSSRNLIKSNQSF